MDLLQQLAVTTVLSLIAGKKKSIKFYPALAKVYAKIEVLAKVDQQLAAEITHQRKKEGLE